MERVNRRKLIGKNLAFVTASMFASVPSRAGDSSAGTNTSKIPQIKYGAGNTSLELNKKLTEFIWLNHSKITN